MSVRREGLLSSLLVILVCLLGATPSVVGQGESDRIPIDELKHRLDRGEKIIILDARAGSSWLGSQVKIKGAIHFTADQLEARIDEIPRNRDIVIYCT